MKASILGTLGIAISAVALVACSAHASQLTLNFAGPGVGGHLVVSYGSAADTTYSQAFKVTGISGTFTDTNNGLTLVDAPITGLVPISPTAPEVTNLLAPADFSKFAIASGSAFGDFSYDNLVWPTGSVQTATDYAVFGGFLDIYGLLFTVDGGYTVNFWSNGDSGSGVDYGVGVATAALQYDYVSTGVALVPEIDPAGLGSVLAFVTGTLALIERRRLKTA
jgi:hypothetical protein